MDDVLISGGADVDEAPRADIAHWHASVASVGEREAQRRVLARARAAEVEYGAFVSIATGVVPHPAGAASGGPLCGVPFAVKDNIDTEHLPTTGGTAGLARWRPEQDARAVDLLRRAGAWVAGKTNLHELALGVTSDNATYGPVRNPADPSRSAGGSSGGSAVAVALSVVPFALGTDTGGSMTIPAAACGVVGYRPSADRYPATGVINLSPTRDEVGVMATSVADVETVDRVMRSADRPRPAEARPAPTRMRLGLPSPYVDDLDGAIATTFDQALRGLRESGCSIEVVPLDDVVRAARDHGFALVGYEAPRALEAYLRRGAGPITGLDLRTLVAGTRSEDVRVALTSFLDRPVERPVYEHALGERLRLRARVRDVLHARELHALIYPTVPAPPPLAGDHQVRRPGGAAPAFDVLTRHTEAGSFAGNPSITVPAAPRGAPPVGVTLEGAHGTDLALLRLAGAVTHVLEARDTLLPARRHP